PWRQLAPASRVPDGKSLSLNDFLRNPTGPDRAVGKQAAMAQASGSVQPAGDLRAQCRRKGPGAEIAAEVRGSGCRILHKRIDAPFDPLCRQTEALVVVA